MHRARLEDQFRDVQRRLDALKGLQPLAARCVFCRPPSPCMHRQATVLGFAGAGRNVAKWFAQLSGGILVRTCSLPCAVL